MKLSTRTRYGIRAIIELAQHGIEKPLQLKLIAQRQDISVKYLEQLITILKSAGFVRSIRGSKGGYILARPADHIKLSEVFNCLEGSVTTAECVDDMQYCERSSDCVARELWMEVEKAIENVLQAITLQDLVDRARSKGTADYQI